MFSFKKYKKVSVIIFLGIGLMVVSALYNYFHDNFWNKEDYRQKVVLITGTASGIGKATAEHLVAQGHIVYGGDIQTEKNSYLEKIGGIPLHLDVTQNDMVTTAVELIIKRHGRIDVLVNNAGYGLNGTVEDVTIDDAMHQLDVNVLGYARMAKEVLPHMRLAGRGTIVNISSMGGRMYFPLGAWYHASKYAVEGLSDAMRFETALFGVDVVLIEPGLIKTNFSNVASSYRAKYAEGSAYSQIYAAVLKSAEDNGDQNYASPSIIAETIDQAISAQIPETRYLVGPLSHELVFLKRWLGDRQYDWLMSKLIGL